MGSSFYMGVNCAAYFPVAQFLTNGTIKSFCEDLKFELNPTPATI